ncbi:hypothetical protein GO986_14390 [Deinococcus sp. HMF7620]|uniref:Annexin n=1 Tax=Deinococcus arboris TaxID=2682977 RepID=A0A7C9ICK9_9DEIO|nr:hypothetical protein [Deinococcus arboris]MVN87946.1 hypothetical protein [Deinococcus arboris]
MFDQTKRPAKSVQPQGNPTQGKTPAVTLPALKGKKPGTTRPGPVRQEKPAKQAAPTTPGPQQSRPAPQELLPTDNTTQVGTLSVPLPEGLTAPTEAEMSLAFIRVYMPELPAAYQEGYARGVAYSLETTSFGSAPIRDGAFTARITPYWVEVKKHPEKFQVTADEVTEQMLTGDLGDLPGRTETIYNELHARALSFTDSAALRGALEDLTDEQMRQLKALYYREYGVDLEQEFARMDLAIDGQGVRTEVLRRLRRPRDEAQRATFDAETAAQALINDLGVFDDVAHMEKVLRQMAPGARAAFKAGISTPGTRLNTLWFRVRLARGDGSTDMQVLRALVDGDPARAAALRLSEAIQGWFGGRDALKTYSGPGAGASGAEIIAAYARLRPGRDLLTDLRAAYGDDAWCDEAIASLSGKAAEATAARMAQQRGWFSTDGGKMAEELENKEDQERQAALAAFKGRYGEVGTGLNAAQQARIQAAASSGKVPEWMILRDAIEGAGTDEDAIRKVLSGRKKEDVVRIAQDYQQHTRRSLEADLFKSEWGFAELDGRDAFEIRQALRGAPESTAEKVQRVKDSLAFERGSTAGSAVMDGLEWLGQHSTGSRLRQESQALLEMVTPEGNLKPGVSAERFEQQFQRQQAAGRSYARAESSAVDTIKTAASITASALATLATGGLASGWLAATLAGVVGAATGVGVDVALRGGKVGSTQIATDAVTGALAAAVGGVLRDGSQLTAHLDKLTKVFGSAYARKVALEAARSALNGATEKGLEAATNDANWRAGYLAYVAGIAGGAGRGGLAGSVSGATKGVVGQVKVPGRRAQLAVKAAESGLETTAGQATELGLDLLRGQNLSAADIQNRLAQALMKAVGGAVGNALGDSALPPKVRALASRAYEAAAQRGRSAADIASATVTDLGELLRSAGVQAKGSVQDLRRTLTALLEAAQQSAQRRLRAQPKSGDTSPEPSPMPTKAQPRPKSQPAGLTSQPKPQSKSGSKGSVRPKAEGAPKTPKRVALEKNRQALQEDTPQTPVKVAPTPAEAALIERIGRSNYDSLARVLRAAGVTDAPPLMTALLGHVYDPLELRAHLRKVDSPAGLLDLFGQYPAPAVREALSSLDSRSIKPAYALRVLRLQLASPVTTTPLRPEQAALLNTKVWTAEAIARLSPEDRARLDPKPNTDVTSAQHALLDSLYRGRNPQRLADATPQAQADDAALGERYQAVLKEILADSSTDYVYRITSRWVVENKYKKDGKIPAAFMTNVQPTDANEAAYMAQIEGRWYAPTEGLPEVVLKIPKSALRLESVRALKISGDNPDLLGYELTTAAYPTAGQGGVLQFSGETTTFDPAWVIPLQAVNPGRK